MKPTPGELATFRSAYAAAFVHYNDPQRRAHDAAALAAVEAYSAVRYARDLLDRADPSHEATPFLRAMLGGNELRIGARARVTSSAHGDPLAGAVGIIDGCLLRQGGKADWRVTVPGRGSAYYDAEGLEVVP